MPTQTKEASIADQRLELLRQVQKDAMRFDNFSGGSKAAQARLRKLTAILLGREATEEELKRLLY